MKLEILEDRAVPASVDFSQVGTFLFVDLNKEGYVSVQQNKVVTSFGNFNTVGTITDVVVNGSKGDDVIEVNISANATLFGNKGDDTIFGGTGRNVIDAGDGKDVVYALLGVNTINAQGDGKDAIFTNAGATVFSDNKDTVARFFGAGRTPGSGFVGMSTTGDDAGTLYITPTNGTTYTALYQVGNQTIVVFDFGFGWQKKVFTGVKQVAYFGGTGNDTYINFTNLSEAAYGAGGNDYIVSGTGDFSLLKGSGGNDTLIARADRNDVSTNPNATSVDVVYLLNGQGKNTVRAGQNDVIFGLDNGDVLVPQLF